MEAKQTNKTCMISALGRTVDMLSSGSFCFSSQPTLANQEHVCCYQPWDNGQAGSMYSKITGDVGGNENPDTL